MRKSELTREKQRLLWEDKAMKKENGKKMFANAMTSVATLAMVVAANSRCVFIYHQPKQPVALKKFRKF